MLRSFWTVLATSLILAVIALSMAMNFSFGYALGSTELHARILGGLSVVCDGLKSLLPLFIAWQWADQRTLAALLAALLFLLLLAYGSASAIGFAAQNRGEVTTRRDALSAELHRFTADLAAAETQLAALPRHRLPGVIEADIASLRLDRIWQMTKACAQATLSSSRDFCKRLHTLRAELAIAGEALALNATIQHLKSELQRTRSAGAGRDSDPQTRAITDLIRLDPSTVRSALAGLLALTVEAISAFGLFAVTPRRRRTAMARTATDTGAPWRLIKAGAKAGPKAG